MPVSAVSAGGGIPADPRGEREDGGPKRRIYRAKTLGSQRLPGPGQGARPGLQNRSVRAGHLPSGSAQRQQPGADADGQLQAGGKNTRRCHFVSQSGTVGKQTNQINAGTSPDPAGPERFPGTDAGLCPGPVYYSDGSGPPVDGRLSLAGFPDPGCALLRGRAAGGWTGGCGGGYYCGGGHQPAERPGMRLAQQRTGGPDESGRQSASLPGGSSVCNGHRKSCLLGSAGTSDPDGSGRSAGYVSEPQGRKRKRPVSGCDQRTALLSGQQHLDEYHPSAGHSATGLSGGDSGLVV
ncbi:MAG: hypothetical protein BWY71_01980 [Planctomycetes bacterium ADurb.Bin412]|nr:MAG: hypothetical protein BWY71_01980 [Planctomycetes bacterium ADurb.Bin412]